jgi:hypothetical protein
MMALRTHQDEYLGLALELRALIDKLLESIKSDGKRIYGVCAGNPDGWLEDIHCCITEVQERGNSLNFYQCWRKRGHGPQGLYCKQHGKKEEERRGEG